MTLTCKGQATLGEVRVQQWARPARLGRAVKIWLALWGLGIAAVLVPVAHFFLVPAFLIAGPILAVKRARQTSGILGGQGTCPVCRRPLVIEAGPEEWPLFALCAPCQNHAKIEVAREPSTVTERRSA